MNNHIIDLLSKILEKLNLKQSDQSPETLNELHDLRTEVSELNNLIIKDQRSDRAFKYLNLTFSIFPTVAAIALSIYVFLFRGQAEFSLLELREISALKDSLTHVNDSIINLQNDQLNYELIEERDKQIKVRRRDSVRMVLVIPFNDFKANKMLTDKLREKANALSAEIKAREYALVRK